MSPGNWTIHGAPYCIPSVWTEDGKQCVAERIYNKNEEAIARLPELLRAAEFLAAFVADPDSNITFTPGATRALLNIRNISDAIRKGQ